MNILNKPISSGGHAAFPASKDAAITSFHGRPTAVRFDGSSQQSTPAAGRFCCSPKRQQPQTLGKASNYVGIDDEQLSLLDDPRPTADQKKIIGFQPLTLNFLQSLLQQQRRRSSIADDDAAGEGDDSSGGASSPATQPMFALRVMVSSAVELDAWQMNRIARKMRRLTGFQNLRMENVIDESLIAGFVISYGADESHVIDLSVKGQLAALKKRVDAVTI